MVPPPPERFSTTAFWPQADCRCAASRRPITSVEPPAAAGATTRMVSVGRQSARLDRGRIVAVDSAAAPASKFRRERYPRVSFVVVKISLPCIILFCGERRDGAAIRQAGDLAHRELGAGPFG